MTVGLLMCLASDGYAAPIFNNLGLNGEYGTWGGLTVSNRPEVASVQSVGNAFTPLGHDYAFESATLAAFMIAGPPALDVFLMSDAGNKPGQVLEAIHLDQATGPIPVVARSVLRPMLLAGTQYWLVAAVQPGSLGIWFANDTLDLFGIHAITDNSVDWTVELHRTAFRVDGAIVPEPSTLLMIAPFALYLLRRRWSNASAK